MLARNRSIVTFLFASAAFLAGCSEDVQDPVAKTTAKTTEEALREAVAANASAADAEMPRGEVDATVMDRPLDGASTEAFERGLATVRSSAPDGQARRLDSALQYLMAYDLSVKHDKALLYAKLDGKSPNEIIAQAKRR